MACSPSSGGDVLVLTAVLDGLMGKLMCRLTDGLIVGLLDDNGLIPGPDVTMGTVVVGGATRCSWGRRVGDEHAPSPTAKHISAQKGFSWLLNRWRSTGDSSQGT